MYIIEALLDLTLNQPRTQYQLRVASCAVIQAYLTGHDEIKAHFLQRAIAGHKEGEQASNVLIALLQPGDDITSVVLASWIVQDLVADRPEAKAALAAVEEGDASEGEDVLSAISALGSELQRKLQQSADVKLTAAFASTLCILLWDFADGIDDLLSEGSSVVQTLAESTKSPSAVIAGLSATLLGIIYEFSTKDSPIPRRNLSSILLQKLGRNRYLDALSTLRTDPAIRDFDLPKDAEVVELSEKLFLLYLNEYARLRRSIDKDPGIEILPYAAAEAGVERDILDELRGRIQTLESTLSQRQQEAAESAQQAQRDKLQTEQEMVTVQKQAEQEKLELQKESKGAVAEAERVRAVIQKMQINHEQELRNIEGQRQKEREELNVTHSRELASTRQEADRKAHQTKQQTEQGFVPVRQEYERKLAELGNAHRSEQAGHVSARTQLETLGQKHADLGEKSNDLSGQVHDLSRKHAELERSHRQLQTRASTAEADLQAARKQAEDSGAQVEALQKTVAELKEDIKGKDAELATERAGFADLEKELEAVRSAPGASSGKDGTASKEAAKLKQLSGNLAEEVKKLKSDAEGHKDRERELEEDVENRKTEAESAKEGEKGAKDELESLLLVLGEIEGKRDEYKAKVKELGGQVTEDEDEDEEDEDGGDDDGVD